jgi:hypothetical protein
VVGAVIAYDGLMSTFELKKAESFLENTKEKFVSLTESLESIRDNTGTLDTRDRDKCLELFTLLITECDKIKQICDRPG